MRPFQVIVAFACVAGTAAACASNAPPNTVGVTNAQVADSQNAASRASDAVCKRAGDCGEIARGKSYASLDSCRTETRGRAREDLGAAQCPNGVDAARLEACLSDINSVSCSFIGGDWDRPPSCKRAVVCP